jgi:hypothetical protein
MRRRNGRSGHASGKPIEPTLKISFNMSKQTFVITPKNCPRPLKVLGEHAAVLACKAP